MAVKNENTYRPYHHLVSNGISLLLMAITVLSIFTPSLLFFKVYSQYTLYIMFGLLLIGLGAFVNHSGRLMMTSLLCCAALCIYLKQSSNKSLRLPAKTSEPALTVCHISLGNAETDYDTVIHYLLTLQADLLSFQELTPDWNEELRLKLTPVFHYVQTMTRMDQYGMGFFSKLPFRQVDTLMYNEIPNLSVAVRVSDKTLCHLISCQPAPPVNQAAFAEIGHQFNFITQYIREQKEATMVLGDFHLPPWSAEVAGFRNNASLLDGRRDIHTRNVDGSLSLPRIPVEHILFTENLECTAFSEIGNSQVGRLGITGTYQLQNEEMAQ